MNVYKVRIVDSEKSEWFITYMPQIPQINENVGYWFGDDWIVGKVKSVTFEFNENKTYFLAEVFMCPEDY